MSDDMIRELTYFDDVGMHSHTLMVAAQKTSSEGSHMHIWLVPEDIETAMGSLKKGRILVSEYDGAHAHALEAGGTAGGAHTHAVRVRGFNMATAEDGGHGHALGVQRTGRDGPHGHAITVGGVTMQSLTVGQIHAMMQEAMSETEIEGPLVERSSGGFRVLDGGKVITAHETREGAQKAADLAHFLLKCGLPSSALELGDTEWLSKSVDLVEKAAPRASTGGLLGKMDQLIKDCDHPGAGF